MAWQEIPIKNKIFQNVAQSALGTLNAALENCYVTDTGGLTRFPRLIPFATLRGEMPTYMDEWQGDLIAVSGGQVYRVNPITAAYRDVTELAVSGPGRVIFAQTENELLMAAGRSIVKLSGEKTELLSEQAPETTHVGYIAGRVLAIEPRSGRFFFSAVGQYQQWDPLDVLSAEGKPDDITSLLISEFDELLLAGPKSIEQFDESPSGVRPFFKRWGLGRGILAPYTFISVNNQLWGLNNEKEWVAFSSQVGNIDSGDIQNTLESLDDLTGAWAAQMPVRGQRFQVIQFPYATNPYGSKGVTLLYDYLKKRWGSIYGWDERTSMPTKWEGWSYKEIQGKKFVGGLGCIYELRDFDGTTPQRMLWRSGHISRPGNQPFRIEGTSMRIERGNAPINLPAPLIAIRANKDNRGFGRWSLKNLGKTGQKNMTLNFPAMGDCDSVQFEIQVTDNGPIEIAKFDMEVTDLKR